MGYDVALICEKGHVINDSMREFPEANKDYCPECGAQTISSCKKCNASITGAYVAPGVIGGFDYNRPAHCHKCGLAYPWTAIPNTEGGKDNKQSLFDQAPEGRMLRQSTRKKYQVFVSSTQRDLQKERNAVIEAIYRLNHIPVAMEMFNAGNTDQWNLITRKLDECDYFLVIIAHNYGSIHPEKVVSYTQLEYEYAIEKNIPLAAFVIDENASWPTTLIDKTNSKKLDEFKSPCRRF
jgi:transcription elongation factor Elf1